ncbi:MAG TPA: LacI family DNA-binding transcriptional regulator [Bacteroidales bacterium]|nr:LacI family DNA-binding transcriptional regulator [Bacteroidales bacterium]HOK75021.1 LacI family DNA-binding transcriptional regulator [Bacteroidales bacterium]HOM41120.1 LacI family DNA-binding transcriptional regulator [Bacteroidales bacterium]HOU31254.1 LacI family DNA-binding transcriptional regulator [Bacteroidales bacterium]HPP93296.1 LacI family DNA-binding transcriptional regulator [Bacteroidales bacterium]
MKNEKEITIYDIAAELGLSPSTVSRALKDHPGISKETKQQIKETARRMGYRFNKFASNLRLKRTNTIGVVVPKLNSYFMATAITGIERIASKYNYNLIIANSLENEKKEAEGVATLYNSRVDGLIVSLAYNTSKIKHFDIFLKKGIPIVFFDRVFECKGCVRVIIDNFKAGYEAVSHLICQGCKRIIHVGGNLKRNVYNDRLLGYRKALEDNGINYDESLVIINDLTERAGEEVVRKILRMKKPPDAVFTANDTTAVSIILNLQKEGISVPGDIAVVGFNNEPISKVIHPNLTTVNYPAYEVGEMAANVLIDRLNSSRDVFPSTIVLEHNLIIRESSLKNGTIGKKG